MTSKQYDDLGAHCLDHLLVAEYHAELGHRPNAMYWRKLAREWSASAIYYWTRAVEVRA